MESIICQGAHPWNRLINFPFQQSLIVYSSCLRVRTISISHKNHLVVLVKIPYQCWHVDLLLIFRSLICLFVFRQLHSLDFKVTASLSYREDTLTADALILWLLESLPILFCPWAVGIGAVLQMDQLGLDTSHLFSELWPIWSPTAAKMSFFGEWQELRSSISIWG